MVTGSTPVVQSQAPGSVSVVVSVLNEEQNVGPLKDQVSAALEGLDWELIYVDDGSTDATVARVRELHAQDKRVKMVILRRNFGQTPAMVAGIRNAKGETIVTMDGDLQNDPSDIPSFLAKIAEGYDIVVGWRRARQDAMITRKVPSFIANRLIGRVTGVPIRDNGCSLKAYRANLIQNIELYSEMHRFIPAMASMAGSRIIELPVKHHARIHGESKYGLARTYKVLLDLVVVKTLLSSIGNPIKYFFRLALPMLLLALLSLGGYLYTMSSAQYSIVLLGTALLWAIAGGFLIVLGIFAEVLHRPNKDRLQSLAALTMRTGS